MLQCVLLSLVIKEGNSLVIEGGHTTNADFKEPSVDKPQPPWYSPLFGTWYPPLLGAGSPHFHETSVHSLPANVPYELNRTHSLAEVIKTFKVWTFTGPSINGDTIYVITFKEDEDIKNTFGHDLSKYLEKNFISKAATNLGVTAIIVVSTPATIRIPDEHNIRWYASSGTEYNICGHGNSGAAACFPGDNAVTFRPLKDDSSNRRSILVEKKHTGGNAVDTTQTIGSLTDDWLKVEVMPTDSHKNDWLKMIETSKCSTSITDYKFWKAKMGAHECNVVIEVPKGDCLETINNNKLCQAFDGSKFHDEKTRGVLVISEHEGAILYRAFYKYLGLCEDKVTGSAFALITSALNKDRGATMLVGKQISKGRGDGTGEETAGTIQSTVEGGQIKLKAECKVEDDRNQQFFKIPFIQGAPSGVPKTPKAAEAHGVPKARKAPKVLWAPCALGALGVNVTKHVLENLKLADQIFFDAYGGRDSHNFSQDYFSEVEFSASTSQKDKKTTLQKAKKTISISNFISSYRSHFDGSTF